MVPRTSSPKVVNRASAQVAASIATAMAISTRLYEEMFVPPRAILPKLVETLRPCGPNSVVTTPTRKSERPQVASRVSMIRP